MHMKGSEDLHRYCRTAPYPIVFADTIAFTAAIKTAPPRRSNKA
jgi:hypothetical protein